MKESIFSASDDRLQSWLEERGQPRFRVPQIRQWIVQRRVVDFEKMTDLPAGLRTELAEHWVPLASSIAKENVDADGTTKLLVRLADGEHVECVLIPEGERRTVCLSTQVGCGMGCVFCASGLKGVVRNLTSLEMMEQLVWLNLRQSATDRLNHVVVMGMGEPLANLDNLMVALEFATNDKGLGISARNITISTVGLPGRIRQLAMLGKPYHLAVSLHAPNNELRQQIVPTAEKIELKDILSAADHFRDKTGRQVTFEYVLLGGINDQAEHASQLVRLLAQRDAMINLIPYNPVSGLSYRTPMPGQSRDFAMTLRRAGYTVKIRKRKGSKINAACGQLRRVHQDVVSLTSPPSTGENR
ncbi:23S rRNA (adenine(2503)-C(2))-methyltransferase RlmN [bacterium]|nr:23S rRNA (adenine(2503)-C(2))-methyltransferase RlmN [bacterium]